MDQTLETQFQLVEDILDAVSGNSGQYLGSSYSYETPYFPGVTIDTISDYSPSFAIENSYDNVYYMSKDECNADLKLLSADLVIVEKNIVFSNATTKNSSNDVWDQRNIYLEGWDNTHALKESCVVSIKSAQINFKFNKPGFHLSFGPAVGTDKFMTNLVCSQAYNENGAINKNNAAKCGLQTDEEFIGSYDGEKTVKTFNALFPTWQKEVCEVFVYPPYQCTVLTQPSLMNAFGNALAIFHSTLSWLFIIATQLLLRGYGFRSAEEEEGDGDGDSGGDGDGGGDGGGDGSKSGNQNSIELGPVKSVQNPVTASL